MNRAGLFKKMTSVLLLVGILLVAGCHKRSVFPQTHDLDEQTKVVLVDAWMLDHSPPFYQALVEYDGVDPSKKYEARAFLQAADGRFRTGNMWNRPVPVAPGPSGKPRVIWEFADLPVQVKEMQLEILFRDKQIGMTETVKFRLPKRGDVKRK